MNISPTPWTRGDLNSVRDADQNVICFFAGDKLNTTRLAANMRIVLMAPTMLYALRKVAGDCELVLAGLDAHPDDFAVSLLASEVKRLEGEIRRLVREVES